MVTDTIEIAPSIVLLAPSTREWLIERYTEIADCERDDLKRPAEEAHARRQIARLQAQGDLSLAEMLDASHA